MATATLAGCATAPPSYAVDVSSPTFTDDEQVVWWTEIRQVDYGEHKANGVVLVRCVRRPHVDCERYRIEASESRAAEVSEPEESRDDSGDEPQDSDEGSGSGLGDVGF
ncbi:MAG: hypothetical protein ACOCUS_06985 [Polyangiales bacterium]